MTTCFGTQSEYLSALHALLELEYDALQAYETAINRLDDLDYRAQIENFRIDHVHHITALTNLLIGHQQTPPTGPTIKSIMTQGKVIIGNLINDDAILRAMASNEEDTNTAYAKLCQCATVSNEDLEILKQAYNNEQFHKAWINKILNHESNELRHFG